MKVVLATLAFAATASAFAPSVNRPAFATSLSAAPAKSHEEDIEMTLKVLQERFPSSTEGMTDADLPAYTPKPKAAAPAPAAAPAASSSGVELWSVDYDAAARLAYEADGSKGDFAAYRTKYLEETSAMIAAKSKK